MVKEATLSDVQTPALVLDRERLNANAQRMIVRARDRGARVRPHMKTLKSIDAARLAIDPAHGGIAVATINEAAYFAGHGLKDIQLAVCLPPGKFNRAAGVLSQAGQFSFFIDSIEVARALREFSEANGVMFRVWIEIDSGAHRTGVDPAGPALLDIAGALAGHACLAGVATHAGQSYVDVTPDEIAAIAETERLAVVEAAARLRAKGHDIAGVSAGSTPTAAHALSAEGLTEWRAGVYLAGDLFQSAIHSLEISDIALSVVASVISRNRARRQIVVDAGGLALSKDRSTAQVRARDYKYGLVADIEGNPVFGALHIDEVHQEHGEIHNVPDAVLDALPIGARVRIFPNHACMTAAMYDEYMVVEGGGAIHARWPRTNGWS
jgi:D-serine deaminase-like pyridoxal phosphate-dependent protein